MQKNEKESTYLLVPEVPVKINEMGLTINQSKALVLSNSKSQELSANAYDKLIKKLEGIGLNSDDLNLIVNYVVNIAPILIHVNLTKILGFICNDNYYRNQFETNTSGGLLNNDARIKWEEALFGSTYEKTDGFNKVKYGVLNFTNSSNGVDSCFAYGDSYFVLKNDIKKRTTLTRGDSSQTNKIGTFDYLYHILCDVEDSFLGQIHDLAIGNNVNHNSDYKVYIECQIHGNVSFSSDIENLVVNNKHKEDKEIIKLLYKFSLTHQCPFVWMDTDE